MKILPKTIIIVLIFLFLIAEFLHPITAMTQDLGRHLLVGKIILQTHSVPQTNLFSYTYPDFPFINHHWFSEVLFFVIQQGTGFTGLLLISTLIIVASFSLLFFFTIKRYSIFAIAPVSLLYIRILGERTDIRPEIFSFLFLSLFITILYKNREKCTRWIFLLPLLSLFWVNIHIYFPIGLTIIGLFLIDNIVCQIKNPNTKIRNPKQYQNTNIQMTKMFGALGFRTFEFVSSFDIRISNLLLILLLCIFATLFNPSGIQGALYPLHVFQNYGYQIEENQNLFFLWNYFGGKTTIFYFFLSSTLLFVSLLLTIKKARLIDWLLAIFFTGLAIQAERNLPLFVFATFIPFVTALSTLSSRAQTITSVRGDLPEIASSKAPRNDNNSRRVEDVENPGRTPRGTRTIIFFILIALFLWQIKEVITLRPLGLGVEIGAQFGADFFIKNKLKGPIFNNFDIGSYLEYRLYPQEKVFVDGRPEAYPVSFFQNTYIPMQINPTIFEQQAKKYNLNTIFFSHTDQTPWAQAFLPSMLKNPNWTAVYLDDYVIIFLKNTKANEHVIKKYGMTLPSLRISNLDATNKISYLRLANFFRVTGLQDNEAQIYIALLKADPTNCIALSNLSNILSGKSNPTAFVYIQQFQQFCR